MATGEPLDVGPDSAAAVPSANGPSGAEESVTAERWRVGRFHTWRPEFFAVLLTLEFVALVYLFLAWQHEWIGIRQQEWPAFIGVFPIIAPWAGALGGVTIGMVSLAAYWDKHVANPALEGSEWNAWYLFRVPLGAAMGSAGALIVVVVTQTLATTKDGVPEVPATGQALLAVVAFAIGYRQQSFQLLLDRLFDVVLGEDDDDQDRSHAPTPKSFTRRGARRGFGRRGRATKSTQGSRQT